MDEPLVDRNEDGIDLTLVRWMLSLTPDQRLEALESYVRDVMAIREENARG